MKFGNCEVCGCPTSKLYLDSGVWKCENCVNPQIFQESLSQPLKINSKGIPE